MQELHKLKEGNNRKFKIIQYGTRWMTSRIPLDWDNKKLKEVVRFRQGLQIAKVERYRQGGKNRIKLIKVMDFGPDSVSDEYIDIPPQSRSVVCNKDDILIARTGTLGLVLTNVEGVFHNNTFALDYDRNILDKMFFYYFLKAPHVQLFIQIISTRTSQSDLTHREFSRLTVFIPPMKEQQKIASILSKVDELIQKTEQANEQTQKLKKGLMQRLLTKGIGHTKFKKVKLQFSFLQQVFPETWEIILLKDLSVDGLSNGIFKKREEFGKGVPIVNVSDLFYENDIDLSRLERVDVTESELRAFGIRQGDVFSVDHLWSWKE